MVKSKNKRIAGFSCSLRIGIICIGWGGYRWDSAFHICSTGVYNGKGEAPPASLFRVMRAAPSRRVKLGHALAIRFGGLFNGAVNFHYRVRNRKFHGDCLSNIVR